MAARSRRRARRRSPAAAGRPRVVVGADHVDGDQPRRTGGLHPRPRRPRSGSTRGRRPAPARGLLQVRSNGRSTAYAVRRAAVRRATRATGPRTVVSVYAESTAAVPAARSVRARSSWPSSRSPSSARCCRGATRTRRPSPRFGVFLLVFGGWIVSLCLHEFAHAFAALPGGRPQRRGRGLPDPEPVQVRASAAVDRPAAVLHRRRVASVCPAARSTCTRTRSAPARSAAWRRPSGRWSTSCSRSCCCEWPRARAGARRLHRTAPAQLPVLGRAGVPGLPADQRRDLEPAADPWAGRLRDHRAVPESRDAARARPGQALGHARPCSSCCRRCRRSTSASSRRSAGLSTRWAETAIVWSLGYALFGSGTARRRPLRPGATRRRWPRARRRRRRSWRRRSARRRDLRARRRA